MTDATAAGFLTKLTISAGLAERALSAAQDEARKVGIGVCISVADAAGHLLAFLRMDGAPLLSAQLSQDKAFTVCAFKGLPSDEWWNLVESEPALLHGIVKTERLIIFGGGVPVTFQGNLVGAVGVSGGSAEEDKQIATAAARSVGSDGAE